MSLKGFSHYAPSNLSLSSVHCLPNACLSRGSPTTHLSTFPSHLSTVLQMHVSQEALPLRIFPPFPLICPLSSKCMSLKRLSHNGPSHLSHLSTVLQMHVSQEALPLRTFPPFSLICPLSSKCMSLKSLSHYAPSHLSVSSVHCPPNACLSRVSPTTHLPTLNHFKPTLFVRSDVTPAVNANAVILWDSNSTGFIPRYQGRRKLLAPSLRCRAYPED